MESTSSRRVKEVARAWKIYFSWCALRPAHWFDALFLPINTRRTAMSLAKLSCPFRDPAWSFGVLLRAPPHQLPRWRLLNSNEKTEMGQGENKTMRGLRHPRGTALAGRRSLASSKHRHAVVILSATCDWPKGGWVCEMIRKVIEDNIHDQTPCLLKD